LGCNFWKAVVAGELWKSSFGKQRFDVW
jgi:hypothetical protein